MTATTTVTAVKFAAHPRGLRGDFFHGSGALPWDDPVEIGYYVWLIRTEQADLVFDVGFTPEVARRRNRPEYDRSPSAAIELLGVAPDRIPYVVISHLHYDHSGDHAPFAEARFVLQDAELAFWSGRNSHRREFLRHVEPDDIVAFVRYSLEGRVAFVDGEREILPGVSVHRVGGHTPGMQVLRVVLPDGPIVLASDASHLTENLVSDAPNSVFTDLPAMYEGFDRMVDLAGGDQSRVYPGHDSRLLDRLVPVPGLEGVAGRIAASK
jgi:glyoxylase-like metal-dependent hydrolase (beta-lactamase superfamily II)